MKSKVKPWVRKYLEREADHLAARRGERLIVTNYPGDHNPYLPHERTDTCFPVCRMFGEA